MTNKTASMKLAQVVAMATTPQTMHKQAGAGELWDAVKKHVSNNRLAYLGGATGATLGALSAIGGPWWRYLAGGGVGAAAGAGIGFAGDRMRNRALAKAKSWEEIADYSNNQAIRLSDELTAVNARKTELEEENRQLAADRDLNTDEAIRAGAKNAELKKKLAQLERDYSILKGIVAAHGTDVGESTPIPEPLSGPGAPHNSY